MDGILNIATGMAATSKVWKNTEITWPNLVLRLSQVVRTSETYKEYIGAKKDEQGKIKDVGGFVGGYLKGGKRSPINVGFRQVITLDIDFAHTDFWEDFTLQYGNAAVLHSTHKHCESDPRYRLVMPLSRQVTPDEYVAISRKIAGNLGIELFDNTTFETNRLMFWPSVSKDVEYYFQVQEGAFVDADAILATYLDWRDSSLWPTADRRMHEVNNMVAKQEDPREKKNIVGFFCKTYSITEAIERFLPDVYVPSTIEDRYSYTKGTTASGLIIYEDLFAFSHHGTDPCSNRTCNAFDLVRIHQFGHLDGDVEASGNNTKSFKAMEEFLRNDIKVKKTIAYENIVNAKYDFATVEGEETELEQDEIDWMTGLESDSRGNYLSSAPNINLILANDQRLKGTFRQNDFDNKRYVFNNLPWRRVHGEEPVKNVDYSGVRNYIETVYGIAGSLKIDDSMALEFEKHSYHPIKDYLSGLYWDGTNRVDTLLIDFFGAEDNIYTREAIRKMMVAAVARVYNPGCKFDLVLVLVGPQGTMKSSFIKKLGKKWFSDTFLTVQGKEALEQIQGAWLIEIAELSALRKAEVEAIKHFISKQEDVFRPAYARTAETYPRQCVFVGTTNEADFLNDPSGNRRFMPIDVHKERVTKKVYGDLEPIIDQLWAEAVHMYNKGEMLILSPEAERIAKGEQLKHSKEDDRKGQIEMYLDRTLPKDWEDRDILQRRMFLEDDKEGTEYRDMVCNLEIWCECWGKNKADVRQIDLNDISKIMNSMSGWEKVSSGARFKLYGKQRYYRRKLD